MEANQRCNTQQENTSEHSRSYALREHAASYCLHMKLVVQLVTTDTDDETLKQAQEILRHWDGDTQISSRGAALAEQR